MGEACHIQSHISSAPESPASVSILPCRQRIQGSQSVSNLPQVTESKDFCCLCTLQVDPGGLGPQVGVKRSPPCPPYSLVSLPLTCHLLHSLAPPHLHLPRPYLHPPAPHLQPRQGQTRTLSAALFTFASVCNDTRYRVPQTVLRACFTF
jgi:hypothetical protein